MSSITAWFEKNVSRSSENWPPDPEISAIWQSTPNVLYDPHQSPSEQRAEILGGPVFRDPNVSTAFRPAGDWNVSNAYQRENEQDDKEFWQEHDGRELIPPVLERAVENYYQKEIEKALFSSRQRKLVIYDVGADSRSYISWSSVFWGNAEIIGFGLNQSNLRRNPVLKTFYNLDFNRPSGVQFNDSQHGDKIVDMMMINFAFCYCKNTQSMLQAMQQKLKCGGKVHVLFGRSCMKGKAIRRWLESDMQERIDYICSVFKEKGGWKVNCVPIEPYAGEYEELIIAVVATNITPDPQ